MSSEANETSDDEGHSFNLDYLNSPMFNSPPHPRRHIFRGIAAGNQKHDSSSHQRQTDNHEDEVVSPLSKFRQNFFYHPQTPESRNRERDVINLESSSSAESESETELLPTPTPTPRLKPTEVPKRGRGRPRGSTKTKGNPIRQRAAARDADGSADELASNHQPILPKRKPSKLTTNELSKSLEKLIELLLRFENPEQIADHLVKRGVEHGTLDKIYGLKTACERIAQLLPSSPGHREEVPATISYYDKLGLYLAEENLVYLMQPVHVFIGNKTDDKHKRFQKYQRQKTFGLVRLNRNSLPLMCSFSGGKGCTEDHPQILDAEEWTNNVKHWIIFHDQPLPGSLYDLGHGKGHCLSTHVELRLMLWLACYLVKTLLGYNGEQDFKKLLGHIWELKQFNGLKAEIVISHTNKKPCLSCQKFHATFEKYSGIKFHIHSCPTLGRLKMRRDKSNNNVVDQYADDTEWEQSDDGEDTERRSRGLEVATYSSKSSATTFTTAAKHSSVVSTQQNINITRAPFGSMAKKTVNEMKAAKAAKKMAHKRARNATPDDNDDENEPQRAFLSSAQRKQNKRRRY